MIRLTGRNIGVRPRFYDNKTESGLLYIPEDSVRRANQGTVAFVGSEVKDISLGDYVLFSGYSGTTVRIDDGIIIILNEDFVTCRLDDIPLFVPGLFLRAPDNTYFAAPFESVTNLLNLARDTYDVKAPPPPRESYDREA